jgi:hypothetical protein
MTTPHVRSRRFSKSDASHSHNKNYVTVNHALRSTIAYIAARLISGHDDYARSKYVSFTGSVDITNVNLFDYERDCYLTGRLAGGSGNLFDYGAGQYLQIHISGSNFKGFDYATSAHFQGSVSERAVQLYDYEHGAYFNYQIN